MPSDDARRYKQLRADYAHAFKSSAGQRVLRDLMRCFHVSTPHLSRDPLANATAEGQRSAVLHIFTMLRFSDRDIERMIMTQPTMYDDEDF